MTTTDTKTEYVTDVEHEHGCWHQHDRSALYLARHIIQVQTPYFCEEEGVERIAANDDRQWEFEDSLEPIRLTCSGCDAFRYVALDKYGDVVKLTPEKCQRHMVHHITNYSEPCEYCGYVGAGGAS